MQTCEGLQNLLLEFVYDLLEDGDRTEVKTHLESCAACQAALTKVQSQQKLFAAAAKMEFPAVRFVEPAPSPAATLPLPKPVPTGGRAWRRWAAAAAVWVAAVGLSQWVLSAAVMVVLFAIAGSVAWFAADYAVASQYVHTQEAELAQLKQQETDVAAQRQELPGEWAKKLVAIDNEAREKQLRVLVSGPAVVQPGAPNTYQMTATDLNGAPAKANISVQLMKGTEKVNEPIAAVAAAQPGQYLVNLPADLPLPAGGHLEVLVSAERENGQKAQIHGDLALAAAPVYLTHLTTDKPMYQPGEVVHFRSLTLDRATLKPAREDLRFHYYVTTPLNEQKDLEGMANAVLLLDDAGNSKKMIGPDGKPIQGVTAGNYYLDANAPGGEYTLKLVEERNRFPAQERKFIVNRYQKPQINKELDYGQKTYGVGDTVTARCKATDTKNAPVVNRPVVATVQIDGKTYDAAGQESNTRLQFATDEDGAVNVRFKLPQEIAVGRASLTVSFTDGANLESMVRPIPLVLKKLNVDFYPEGGELIAGLENRVYFQVRTTLDKPADLKGHLLEDGQPLAVELQTLTDEKEPGVNQGLGVFAFTPKPGRKYAVHVDSPAGINQQIGLPAVKDDGVALTVEPSVVRAEQPIHVKVQSTRPRVLVIGAYCRGQLLDTVRLDKGQSEATLHPGNSAGGVCRVTVFEELEANVKAEGRREVKPVAERLIYREPAEMVKLAIHPDQSSYLPGQKVKMTIEGATETDEPAPAIVVIGIVDKRVLTLADEKTARTMPTHLLLATEVRHPEDLEYADFLLGPQEKARVVLDLLLATQGWRKFAEQNPAKFRQENKDAADTERLLYVAGQSQPVVTDFTSQEIAKVEQHYRDEAQRLEEAQTRTVEQRQAAAADVSYAAALAKLANYRGFYNNVNRWILPGLGVVLFAVAVVCILRGLRRSVRHPVPYFAVAGLCAVALLIGVETYLANLADQQQQLAQADTKQAAPNRGEMSPPAPAPDRDVAAERKDDRWADKPAAMPPAAKEQAKDAAKNALPEDEKKEGRPQMRPMMRPNIAPAGGLPKPGPAGVGGPGAPPPPVGAAAAPQDKAERNLKGQGKDRDLAPPNVEKPAAEFKNKAVDGLAKAEADAKKRALNNPADWDDNRAKLPFARPMADNGAMPGPANGLPNGGFGGGGGLRGGGGGRGGFQGPAPGAGKPGPGGARQLFDAEPVLPQLPPVIVREYAHKRSAAANSELREDFAETLYWHPVLVLPKDGKAEISFDLCDSVTTFQVTAFAHTVNGRLGAVKQTFDARLPFTLEPKVPIEVTSSDKIDIPLSIANNGADKQKVHINVAGNEGLSLLRGDADSEIEVPNDAPLRKVYRFQPTLKEGRASVTFAGKAGTFADTTRNSFAVVPEGFPIIRSASDLLEGSATHTVTLPQTWVKDTLKVQVNVYPSTLADLQKGLDSLLREPNGCFEQTSTSNYPNLLILDYLKESDQTKPEVERKARDLLARGYQKLTSFECTNPGKNAKQGYEWFGGTAPAHEALTAYGLLQFRDMARVQEVDPQMVERTKQYLMSQRDGKGGFKRNPRALDTFGRAPDNITNAYIVWALTEGGQDDDVTTELKVLHEQAKTSNDPYFISLVANSLINRAKTGDATALLKKVVEEQKADGHLDARQTSITGSGGRDLQIETTALAVLGWLKANPGEFNVPVQKAIKWVGQQRGGYGGFGSTQSTILALKALIAYARAHKGTPSPGELKLFVGDKEVAKLPFPAGASEALTLTVPNPEELLKAGPNKVRIEVTGKNAFPYTLSWSYSTLQPVSAENCPVLLSTKLAQAEIKEGDSVRLTVQVENKTGKGQGMAVAIVGLPGGLTVPEDLKQLKEYVLKPVDGDRPLLSAFEIRGRELILYWRDLAPDQRIEVPVDLIGRVPGEYSGPASRAYLYYNSDLKNWIEPLKLTIAAKE